MKDGLLDFWIAGLLRILDSAAIERCRPNDSPSRLPSPAGAACTAATMRIVRRWLDRMYSGQGRTIAPRVAAQPAASQSGLTST
jgi:hypothetical protein